MEPLPGDPTPDMLSPTGPAPFVGSPAAPNPQADMIKKLLLQRLMQGAGGLGQMPAVQPPPGMLGAIPPRPAPQMIPGQIPAGMGGVRG